ncbi:hypothetical protein BDP27DRAFT_1419383 [Rhodocollybia butyracea]|uniref:THO1-MOS11 C-terminal domain-containing protein n=1 Tax=Rhodocollybia butyracea TaxID=206335 RepID=A0A9P5PZ05_9AGAR|nr:hypothetical protein BDP27DRAFT_1419383 [Rhodocollybia butyracea]
MEAKLKPLKVPDLKQILTKANLSVTAKATRAVLVSKIIASSAAIEAYNELYPSEPAANDDLLAPPEDLDWTPDEVPSSKVEETTKADVSKPTTSKAPISVPTPAPEVTEPPKDTTTATAAPSVGDSQLEIELEKRKQRAARFGIPLVEPKSKSPTAAKKTMGENTDKLGARAERFGLKNAENDKASTTRSTSPGSKRKRTSAPVAEIDPEEAERRRKRAERFGIKT